MLCRLCGWGDKIAGQKCSENLSLDSKCFIFVNQKAIWPPNDLRFTFLRYYEIKVTIKISSKMVFDNFIEIYIKLRHKYLSTRSVILQNFLSKE